MKEFQNWWDEEIDWRVDLLDYTSEVYAKEAWKAALEWALKGLEKECTLFEIGWIGEFIEKELGGQNEK